MSLIILSALMFLTKSLYYVFKVVNVSIFIMFERLQIINRDNVQEAARETDGYFIKSGIVTVIKDAVIPAGIII